MVNDIPAIPLFNGGAWAGYTTVHANGWPSASNPYEMNDLESPWDEVVVLRSEPGVIAADHDAVPRGRGPGGRRPLERGRPLGPSPSRRLGGDMSERTPIGLGISRLREHLRVVHDRASKARLGPGPRLCRHRPGPGGGGGQVPRSALPMSRSRRFLEDDSVELVVNITPPSPMARVASPPWPEASTSISEKPLAASLDEAGPGHGRRGAPPRPLGCATDTFLAGPGQTARAAIDAGLIGEPIAFAAAIPHSRAEDWHPDPTFLFKKGVAPSWTWVRTTCRTSSIVSVRSRP